VSYNSIAFYLKLCAEKLTHNYFFSETTPHHGYFGTTVFPRSQIIGLFSIACCSDTVLGSHESEPLNIITEKQKSGDLVVSAKSLLLFSFASGSRQINLQQKGETS
jgi:hypothetical protein